MKEFNFGPLVEALVDAVRNKEGVGKARADLQNTIRALEADLARREENRKLFITKIEMAKKGANLQDTLFLDGVLAIADTTIGSKI